MSNTDEVEGECLRGCRTRVLNNLQSKPGLIVISVLVVAECLCLLAVMIAELQILRLEAENAQEHIMQFKSHLLSEDGNQKLADLNEIQDVISFLRQNVDVISMKKNKVNIPTDTDVINNRNQKGDLLTKYKRPLIRQSGNLVSTNSTNYPIRTKNNRSPDNDNLRTKFNQSHCRASTILIVHLSDDLKNMFIVGQINFARNSSMTYKLEKARTIQIVKILSDSFNRAGFVVISMMLTEVIIRLFCKRRKFFKRKFEVFDATIVVLCFTADAAFLDSSWYKGATDVTTILILLLPWRLVRIIYSMVSTLNNKHQLHVQELREERKKIEDKFKKTKADLLQMERDVKYLTELCRRRGASENEIKSCHGNVESKVCLAALSTFSSLFLFNAEDFTDTNVVAHAVQRENLRGIFRDGNNVHDENNNSFDKKSFYSQETRMTRNRMNVDRACLEQQEMLSSISQISGSMSHSTYL